MFDRQEAEALRQLQASAHGLHGSEIAAASGGLLTRGNVYSVLGRLEQAGWVRSEEGRPEHQQALPRTLYHATDQGRRAELPAVGVPPAARPA